MLTSINVVCKGVERQKSLGPRPSDYIARCHTGLTVALQDLEWRRKAAIRALGSMEDALARET
jgi:hypothetical protein